MGAGERQVRHFWRDVMADCTESRKGEERERELVVTVGQLQVVVCWVPRINLEGKFWFKVPGREATYRIKINAVIFVFGNHKSFIIELDSFT